MDARARRVEALRALAACALIIGFLITGFCLLADTTSLGGLFLAGLLVFIGVGLRLEAAIAESR